MLHFTPQKAKIMNLVAAMTFFLALLLNGLANILPINGLSTGVISDTYENYFAPAGFTFSIWAVIYSLLAGYVFWRLKNLPSSEDNPTIDSYTTWILRLVFLVLPMRYGSWLGITYPFTYRLS